MSLFSERRNVETIPFLSRFCSVIIGGPSSSSHFLCCLARLLLSPHSCFFHAHTLFHCFPPCFLSPTLPLHTLIHPSFPLTLIPPSLDLISQSAFYLSVFSHLVATAGKCKLCCFKYPCLPRAYSFRWAAGGVE